MDDSHFFSIDRLIEFGMGMAIAQQMVGSMNNAFQNMSIPGVDTMHQGKAAINDQFYYAMIKDKQVGPLSLKDLCDLINKKEIVSETYLWNPSLTGWKMAEQIPEIVRLVAMTPPPFNK